MFIIGHMGLPYYRGWYNFYGVLQCVYVFGVCVCSFSFVKIQIGGEIWGGNFEKKNENEFEPIWVILWGGAAPLRKEKNADFPVFCKKSKIISI